MAEDYLKFMLWSFILILIGVVLIDALATEIEYVKTTARTIENESISLTNATTNAINETVTMALAQANVSKLRNGTTAFYDVNSLSNIQNYSGANVTAYCNFTLSTGVLWCNALATNGSSITVNYTYVSGKTGTTAFDDINSVTAIRNVTQGTITGACNVTTSSGAMSCNNTRGVTAYIDYQYDLDNRLDDATSRTILSTTLIFFAVAILLLGIAFGYKGVKGFMS